MIRVKRLIIMVLIGLLVLPLASINAIALNINDELPNHVEGVLLVQFEDGLPEQAREAIMEHANVNAVDQVTDKGLILVEVNGNRPIETVIKQLNNMRGVQYAEPDYMLYPIEITEKSTYVDPSDEDFYYLMWGLHNSGQDILGVSGTVDVDIDAPEAWNITAGSNDVVVAVIDTAIDLNHPDLQGKIIDYKKFHKGREDKSHGTHVAGTIAANDNAIGVVGVAPDVKIMGLAFLGFNGGSTSDGIKAINYATANGADIINASWGGGGFSQSLYDAIEAFGESGGIFVAAAGNGGFNNEVTEHYPSSYTNDNIVSVAAINNKGELADFSNYGLLSVDVGAPGEDIASTYPNGYAWMSGTSMATPHVSGILALMKSYAPTSTYDELIGALYAGGVSNNELVGKSTTGKMVNAFNALNALNVTPPENVAPTVSILLPNDGSVFNSGEDIQFTATIDDEDTSTVSILWTSDVDGAIGNTTSFTSSLSVGQHVITALVTDSEGLTGNDVIDVIVNEAPSNSAPTVTITSPGDNSTFNEGESISFIATATDNEDGDLSGQIDWTSDLDGAIASETLLSVGTHTVTASVTDSGGLSGSDSITVNVVVVPSEGFTTADLFFATEGGRYGDAHLLITFELRDGNNLVDGASLSVDLMLDGSKLKSFNGVSSGGQVTFKIKKASEGLYSILNLDIISTPAWDKDPPTKTFDLIKQ